MVTGVDLLVQLERKLEAAIATGDQGLSGYLEYAARVVREIAEAALVAGDEVTLREARRLAARLGPLGFGAGVTSTGEEVPVRSKSVVRSCPRCGRRFRGPAAPLEKVGLVLCGTCAAELLSGIRL
ncbi:MAG: hypothetical protein ACP5SI_00090 [Chloroflexia bacterium]